MISFSNYYLQYIKENRDDSIIPTGEYWFDENGNAMYADGDNGAMNHESYVIQRCTNKVLDYFGLSVDEVISLADYEDSLIDIIKAEVGDEWEDIDDDPSSTIIKYIVEFNKLPEEKVSDLVLTAYGSSIDAREYAIKNWNWIRVHRNNIEVNKLDSNTLQKVAKGIIDALDQEGNMYDDDSYEKANNGIYNISTYTGKLYTITLNDMESGNVSGLEQAVPTKTSASQQIRKMDMENMPDFYKNRGVLGDSYNWKNNRSKNIL